MNKQLERGFIEQTSKGYDIDIDIVWRIFKIADSDLGWFYEELERIIDSE